jgi:hypothetical protein
MMAPPSPSPADLVCAALRQPQHLSALTPAGWDALVRQARGAGLLARIGCMLDAQGSLDRVPDAPRAHLNAAMTLAEFHRVQAMRELALVHEALASIEVEPVLLGGAAYAAAGLLPGMGRLFTDIDIVVPEGRLAKVEAALLARGWIKGRAAFNNGRSDQQEPDSSPALGQSQRQCVVVVHCAVLAEAVHEVAAATGPLGRTRAAEGDTRFAILDPADMALYVMVHLFHRADLGHALCDLSDLDLLLRHCGRAPDFWTRLEQHARDPVLAKPLHHGLRYTNALLGTPVPPASLKAAAAMGGPLRSVLSDGIWARALRPRHAVVSDGWTPLALFALRVRARRRRIPPALELHRRPNGVA